MPSYFSPFCFSPHNHCKHLSGRAPPGNLERQCGIFKYGWKTKHKLDLSWGTRKCA
ncbi:hypothetical protein KSP40_PGU020966 [Platanthera guangdongensis]|uniref:Uncharacterized protein n=1 Tax=Platanthera guangdongensis TaxID=2320717 RepID=A0ABR2LFF4_9ASPA